MLSLNVTRCFALTLYVLLDLPGQPAWQAMAITFPNLRNLALFNRTNLLPAVRVRLHVHTSWLKLNVEPPGSAVPYLTPLSTPRSTESFSPPPDWRSLQFTEASYLALYIATS